MYNIPVVESCDIKDGGEVTGDGDAAPTASLPRKIIQYNIFN